jgi:solute carrier family 25 phosphate transporter 23/24/25/41
VSDQVYLEGAVELRAKIDQARDKLREALDLSAQRQQVLVETVKQLLCGGLAGAASRTVVGPLDRIKLLMQTSRPLANISGNPEKYSTARESFKLVTKEEGWRSLWRGNLINIARVAPYSGIQFASYDLIKKQLWSNKKKN